MENLIQPVLNITEKNYKIEIDVVNEDFMLTYKLSYYNKNTGKSIEDRNASRYHLIRLSDIPVYAKEKIIESGFLK